MAARGMAVKCGGVASGLADGLWVIVLDESVLGVNDFSAEIQSDMLIVIIC